MYAKVMLASALLLAVAASAVFSAPKEKPAAVSDVFRFVGFTDDTADAGLDVIDGGQGMLAMHALCQDEFSLDARMCTSKEFWLSPNAEAPSFADAWLHSDRQGSSNDFTGIVINFNCLGWSASGFSTGYGVTTAGKPAIGLSCAIDRPVTCCAPAQ